MKKIFTLFAAMLFAAGTFAASYGILVNGKMFYAGTQNPNPADPSFQEYMILGLGLKAGDQFQLYDLDNKAGWAVDLDGASVSAVSRSGDHYACSAEGCYDFYIKLKYQNDQLYVGAGQCGSPQGTDITGGDNPGGQGQGGQGQGGGSVEGNPRYYYKGYIDGEDIEPSEETIFDHGIAEIEFTQIACLFVLYQVDGYPGVQYMTSAWTDGPRHTTLVTNGGEKWNCPLGTTKLYLYDNGDGTLEISADIIAGKKLADPQPVTAVENTTVNTHIVKTIENGQVVLIKNGVRYNLLGAQLH